MKKLLASFILLMAVVINAGSGSQIEKNIQRKKPERMGRARQQCMVDSKRWSAFCEEHC